MEGLIQDWPMRLHRILDYAAVQHGGREVVSREPDGSVSRTTYARLRQRALQVAGRLLADDLLPGDRVATLAWNGAAHMEAWYGIAGMGGIYHTVNPRLFPEQIGWIMRHAEDRAVFVDAMLLPLLERLIDGLPALERVIVLGGRVPPGPSRLPNPIAYEDWLATAPGDVRWAEPAETEAAGLCYTSGTTGAPRGVLYSHRSTVLHAMTIATPNVLGLGSQDVVLPVVPMFHVNAWGLPFAAPMMGAKLVMPGSRLDGAAVYGLIEAEGVTMTAGVPTVWMGLLDHMRRNDLGFSTLRRLVVGGSACPRALMEAFERDYGIEVCHAWGMTETSPIGSCGTAKPEVAGLQDAARYDLKQRQGFAPFGVEMKIVDDAGTALPWDGQAFGRLCVRGFAVTRGYFEDEATVLDPDGFFDTGDVATIDPLGYMMIVDRSKDVIKSGGEWISSIAIETLVAGHPDVAEAAVIGLPHPKWGERPLLVVVARAGTDPSPAALLAFLEDRIVKWWLPDDVMLVSDIPHTATGKVSKRLLRARFEGHVFSSAVDRPCDA